MILQDQRWTVPTFARSKTLLEDADDLLQQYSQGKIVPIELYMSADKGFEYGTYVCLVDMEFLTCASKTVCWADFSQMPRNLHTGLKTTLNNQLIRAKIETILVLENDSKTVQ